MTPRDREPRDSAEPSRDDSDLDDKELEKGIHAAFTDAEAPVVPPVPYRSVFDTIDDGAGESCRISIHDIDDHPTPLNWQGAASKEIPKQIGRYRIVGEIARGGVGSIYKARDEDLGRDIALKVLLGGFRDNPEMTRRFMEEAQVAGQLQHPGIVPIHEVGLFSGKHVYFAMKLVKGQTLAQILEKRSDPVEDRPRLLGVFEQICQPLAYAHARGVIHRDLKPSNVMVGGFGEVQVMDWGLAKVLRRGGTTDDRHRAKRPNDASAVRTIRSGGTGSESLVGSVLGTPAYMAPEQARGEVYDLDERSDVFGLGAILCEILTGHPPYEGDTAEDTLRQARKGALDGARSRLKTCGADREVIELAEHCLAVRPKDRPRDAGAVMTAVRDHLESVQQRARRAEIVAAKARMKLIAGLMLALVLSACMGAVFWLAEERAERERQTAAAVDRVVYQAKILRTEAEAGDPADDTVWRRALDVIQRGEALLAAEVDEDSKRAFEAVKAELQAELSKSVFLSCLEDLRDVPLEDGDWKTLHELDSGYASAFEALLGLDVEAAELDDAVNLIRTHAMSAELVVALREWGQVRYLVTREKGGAGWDVADEVSKTQLVQLYRRSNPFRTRDRMVQYSTSREALNVSDPLFVDFANALETAQLVVFARSRSLATDFAPAEFCLRTALRREPGNYRVHYALSRLLRRQRKLDEALRHALIARSLRPERPRPWWSLGLSLEMTGDHDGALEAYTRAVVLDPDEQVFYQQLRALVEQEERPAFGDEALERTLSSLTEILTPEQPGRPETRTVLDLLLYGSIDRALSEPEILIGEGASWRYATNRPPAGLEWTELEFDDRAWFRGVSGFGYGDGDDATILGEMRGNYTSVCIRRVLDFPEPERFRRIEVSLRADDGCLMYVNGRLLVRLRVSEAGVVTKAPEPLVEEIFEIPREELRAGKNLIALEGLNSSLDSSDFSLIPVVRGELAPRAARERNRERLERFRERATGPHSTARTNYFSGRMLQRSGQYARARVKLERAFRADPESPLICFALLECVVHMESDEPTDPAIRELMARSESVAPRFGRSILRTALTTKGWTPETILDVLPGKETPSGWDEIRQFLERLRDGETIRINCGGPEYVSPSGAVWGPDRFFEGGEIFTRGTATFDGDIRGTEDDPIYATERRFSGPTGGYHIPLPAGEYRLALHFAEIFGPLETSREFDVVVEGKKVLSSYTPAQRGGVAHADSRSFDTRVDDRVLDIEFVRGAMASPKISGIEIQTAD